MTSCGRHTVFNHRQLDCFDKLCWLTTKKTSKFHITGALWALRSTRNQFQEATDGFWIKKTDLNIVYSCWQRPLNLWVTSGFHCILWHMSHISPLNATLVMGSQTGKQFKMYSKMNRNEGVKGLTTDWHPFKSHETSLFICGVVCQEQVSRAGTSNYIPHNLWVVITCPVITVLQYLIWGMSTDVIRHRYSRHGGFEVNFNKIRNCHVANSVVNCRNGGCRNDNVQCHPWRQSWHHDHSRFSVLKWNAVLGIHYSDVMMDTMASQIINLTIVYSTVYSGADQRKAPRHWPLCGKFTSDRWIPRAKGHLRGNFSVWWHHHDKMR